MITSASVTEPNSRGTVRIRDRSRIIYCSLWTVLAVPHGTTHAFQCYEANVSIVKPKFAPKVRMAY